MRYLPVRQLVAALAIRLAIWSQSSCIQVIVIVFNYVFKMQKWWCWWFRYIKVKLCSSLRETELLWFNKKWEISYADIYTKKEACVHETAKKGKFGFISCYCNKILEIINLKRIKVYFGSVSEFSTHNLAPPLFAGGNAVMYHGKVHTIEQICSPQEGQEIK